MGIAGSIIGSVVGAVGQAGAAKSAANAQSAAAKKDIAFQKETRDIIRNDLSGYRASGSIADQAYNYELGLGNAPMIGGTALEIRTIAGAQPTQNAMMGGFPGLYGSQGGPVAQGRAAPSTYMVGDQSFKTMDEAKRYADAHMTGGTAYGGFKETPGYRFALDAGNANINAMAGANGGLYSGKTLEALQNNGIGMANQEYGTYMNRLSGQSANGMNAAQMSGQASQFAAGNISNAYSSIGNAQAAGAIGAANAFSTGINNGIGAWQYQKTSAADDQFRQQMLARM